jgi:hypothetical protein
MLCRSFNGVGTEYRNEGSVLSSFAEFNHAIAQCKQGIVPANTNIFSGMVNSTALTYDDVSGNYSLAAKYFYTQTLAVRVTTIFYAAFPFFVCHGLAF